MANFDNIIQEINTNLPDNATQSITAAKMRTTLVDLTDAIKENEDNFEIYVNNIINSTIGGTTVVHHEETFTGGLGEYTLSATLPSANTPFIYNKNFPQDIHISKIKLNIQTTGKLKISYVTNAQYQAINSTALASVAFVDIMVKNITSTGDVEFDVDFTLPAYAHIAFGHINQSNPCTWNWASTSSNSEYGGVFFSSGGAHISAFSNHPLAVQFEYDYDEVISTGPSIIREFIRSVLAGKKVSILGDSISTYQGWIPSTNAYFYPRSGNDVTSVEQTWWKKLINSCEMELCLNNSWSGAKVTGTETSSGVTRASNLANGTTNPDIILVWMGINDFNQEVGLGTWDGTTEMPTSRTTFREAYAIMLNTILTTYPLAKVYCFTLPDIERNYPATNPPEINEAGVSLKTWNDAIKEVADALCVEVIDLSKCGIHWHNLSSYTSDYVHPNIAGHSKIANFLIHNLDNAINKRY